MKCAADREKMDNNEQFPGIANGINLTAAHFVELKKRRPLTHLLDSFLCETRAACALRESLEPNTILHPPFRNWVTYVEPCTVQS